MSCRRRFWKAVALNALLQLTSLGAPAEEEAALQQYLRARIESLARAAQCLV